MNGDDLLLSRTRKLRLGTTERGQRVEARAAIVFGDPPLGRHPASILQSPEGGIEGAFLDAEDVFGGVLDPARDRVSMRGAGKEGFENENAERSLKQVAGVGFERHGRSLGRSRYGQDTAVWFPCQD
jgi:hypothetical protein